MNALERHILDIFNLTESQFQTKYYTDIGVVNYPKYDIVKIDDNNVRIDLALAGKTKDNIEVKVHDGYLFITGKKEETSKVYIRKGISEKEFSIKFRLADFAEVQEVTFVNGILSINIVNKVPEEQKPKVIPIS